MKSVTTYETSYSIKIVASLKTVEAIKHIVRIAPQEAQWFHTVEPIIRKNNQIELHLSEKLYIPKQNTSLAEVNSTSSMMIEFYNTLKEECSDQSIVNQKLTAMTCWCHSHHNMAPNPSSQDQNQFAQLVNQSIDQNIKSWQIMLIFNKDDNFYSKVFDPIRGIVTTGVPIVNPPSKEIYDFSYIDQAAKTKFLKPKILNKFSKPKFDFSNQSNSKPFLQDPLVLNHEIATDLIDDIYESLKSKITPNTKAKLPPKKRIKLTQQLCTYLDSKEYLWLLYYLNNKYDEIFVSAHKTFTNTNYSILNEISPTQEQEYLDSYFAHTTDTLDDLKNKLSSVLSFCDCTSYYELEALLTEDLKVV
jgi:hypothetical protein